MNTYYLTDTWPWFDAHQCYGRLVHYVKDMQPDVREVRVEYGLVNKLIGRAYSLASGHPGRRDSVFAAAEHRFLCSCLKKISPESIYHILFFDNHYQMFERWDKAPRNIIGTVHLPINRDHPALTQKYLSRLSSCIVMFSEGVEYLEKFVGRGRVKFIHYGVDTEFFRAPERRSAGAPDIKRLLFTGQNGRNFAMLKRVILKLSKSHKDLAFDLLVPEFIKNGQLKELYNHPAVKWHKKLPEDALLRLYQESHLLLMPMEDSGVNTAVVEALACGRPIVTTDVGGIRDYGGGSIYPVVKNNDDGAMVALIEQYLSDEGRRSEVAKKGRDFAEQSLSWPVVAAKHIEAYKVLSA